MTAADLNAWASNFGILRGMLGDYESESAQINPNSPSKGTSQLVAFQYGTCQGMLDLKPWLPKPSWLDAVDFGPTEGNEHKLLASYYVLSATLQHVDEAPLEEARTTLSDLANRLADIATRWAENGVNADELEQVLAERRALAQRAKDAADRIGQ
ncbi:hypothetical protein IU421_30020 [Nocardia cyriacigeorgica]|uniref:hypothetical protein n=1 Tax=Nocardia cyriacigeorgica TaxID=135487 RepID=UPI001894C611|nr:hypothetical protein [Nocardia cyriacigeorgica]MBF6518483.1 hypothetical protein [Nocardia cyriacigeorgica]